MTDAMVVSVYFPLLVLIIYICLIVWLNDKDRKPLTKQFVSLGLCIAGWQTLEILYHLSNSLAVSRFLFDAKLVFVAFSAVQVYVLSVRFFEKKKQKRRRTGALLLYVIPLITSCLALTSVCHPFIRAELLILQTEPLHTVVNVRGPWFWVHSAYSYAMLIASTVAVFYYRNKIPKTYRQPTRFLVAGVLTVLALNLLVLTNVLPQGIDWTLVGLSAAMTLVFVALNVDTQESFLTLAREEVFNHLEDGVFVLDPKRTVIDFNRAAESLLEENGVSLPVVDFDEAVARLVQGGAATSFDLEDDGMDMYLKLQGKMLAYNLRERKIRNKEGREIGSFVIFTDVTRYKSLIDKLEAKVGIDALTGMGNRRSLEGMKAALMGTDPLPIGIVLGDLNRLKHVNDTYGHQVGDALLRFAAQALADACPPGGAIFRIGGDEFAALLPRTAADACERFCKTARNNFAEAQGFAFRPSIALGWITKEREDESLEKLMDDADKNMYLDKRNNRRR